MKTFTFYNGTNPKRDPTPIIIQANSEAEAKDKIAQKFGIETYTEFRKFLDREKIRVFNKEKVFVSE